MKVKIDPDLCIGCTACADTCPAVFKMVEDKAVVIPDDVPESEAKACQEAVEMCPTEAIKYR